MSGKYGPNTAEVEAYIALLPTLTAAAWDEAWATVRATVRDAVRDEARDESWATALDAAWRAARYAALAAARYAALAAARAAAWHAARAAEALTVRDLITPEQFDILTAPMRAAGIDFDNLTNHENGSE